MYFMTPLKPYETKMRDHLTRYTDSLNVRSFFGSGGNQVIQVHRPEA